MDAKWVMSVSVPWQTVNLLGSCVAWERKTNVSSFTKAEIHMELWMCGVFYTFYAGANVAWISRFFFPTLSLSRDVRAGKK